MAKKGDYSDNITMFNRLTHTDDGIVDRAVFDKLIRDFEYYILFKKMYCKDMEVKQARHEECIIKFRVEFNETDITKEFIKRNKNIVISFKGQDYSPIIDKIGQQIIDIHFIRK